MRRRAPDRPRGVRRSPARAPRARARRSTCGRSRATRSWPSGAASGSARAAARSWSATSTTCPRTASWPSCSAASRRSRPTAASSPRRRSRRRRWWRRATPTQSHLRMSYRPSIEARDAPAERAALSRLLDAAGRLDGLAPVRRDPRAARAGLLRLRASTTRSPTCRSCSSRPAWTRRSASRPTRACARSSTSCAPTARPRKRSSAPAPTPPAGACWRSRTRTPSPATRPPRPSCSAQDIDPDTAIAALDAVTFDEVDRDRARDLRVALGGLRRTAYAGRVLLSVRLAALPRVRRPQ